MSFLVHPSQPDTLILIFPQAPIPSINDKFNRGVTYWRWKQKCEKARMELSKLIAANLDLLHLHKWVFNSDLKVSIKIFSPSANRIDIDNKIKSLLDIFQRADLIKNDNKIFKLAVEKIMTDELEHYLIKFKKIDRNSDVKKKELKTKTKKRKLDLIE